MHRFQAPAAWAGGSFVSTVESYAGEETDAVAICPLIASQRAHPDLFISTVSGPLTP